jgi:hypothetical protein
LPPEGMTYEDCLICADPLNNVDGPGSGTNCNQFCNDVVVICRNNHKTHRACILNSCNSAPVNVRGQLGYNDVVINRDQERRNKCPFCQVDLITNCNNFINRRIVPKVQTEQLYIPVETRGGFRIRKRKTYKRKKHRCSKKRYSKKRFTRRLTKKLD